MCVCVFSFGGIRSKRKEKTFFAGGDALSCAIVKGKGIWYIGRLSVRRALLGSHERKLVSREPLSSSSSYFIEEAAAGKATCCCLQNNLCQRRAKIKGSDTSHKEKIFKKRKS